MSGYSEGEDANAPLSLLKQSQCLIITLQCRIFCRIKIPSYPDACLHFNPFLTESQSLDLRFKWVYFEQLFQSSSESTRSGGPLL